MALGDVTVQPSAANLGTPNSALTELVARYNDLAAKYEALLAKLDADAGVTDTDYEATVGGAKRVLFAGTGAPTPS
jgi:hypothetical protein